MVDSRRFRDAFKTALAMALAYYIALSLDWERPGWAGLAVAVCSLGSTGASLNKAMQRVLGTLFAVAVTLALIGLFPQDRWLFLLATSLYMGVTAYFMLGSRRWYFWLVAGSSVLLLAVSAGPVAANAFETVMLRAQETLLGVVVYSVVAMSIWPTSGREELERGVGNAVEAQRGLLSLYLRQPREFASDDTDGDELRTRASVALDPLHQLLDDAEAGSYIVWEQHRAWRRCIHELSVLNTALERWRQGLVGLGDLDPLDYLPDPNTLKTELHIRLVVSQRLLAGGPADHRPVSLDLALDGEKFRSLPHFQQAELLLCHAQLETMVRSTAILLDCIGAARGEDKPVPAAPRSPAAPLWDPERLAVLIRQMASFWLIMLVVFYVPSFPLSQAMIGMGGSVTMTLSRLPQVSIAMLTIPVLLSISFAGAVYLLVMPHLTGFAELGTLIFTVTFLIGYLFPLPQNAAGRSVGLSVFVSVIGVSNQQNYSFVAVAGWFVMFPTLLCLLSVARYFPVSFRPEHRFLRIFTRFLHGCDFLVSRTPRSAQHGGMLHRWRWAFHRHAVATIPRQLSLWGSALSAAARGATPPANLQALLASAQALSLQVQELTAARTMAGETLRDSILGEESRLWREQIHKILGQLSGNPLAVDAGNLRAGLDARIQALEAILDGAGDSQISTAGRQDLYRLLGAYRGVAEAVVELARRSTGIDWPRLREARF